MCCETNIADLKNIAYGAFGTITITFFQILLCILLTMYTSPLYVNYISD